MLITHIIWHIFSQGWSALHSGEVPWGRGLWRGGGGHGHPDQREGGHQENFSIRTSNILPGRVKINSKEMRNKLGSINTLE